MPKTLAALCAVSFLALGAEQDDVRRVLETQTAAWNRGDISGFMETYAADTVFIGSEVTRGSALVKERYLRRYPTAAKMGKLSFSDLQVRPVGSRAAYAFGHWHLDRAADAGGPAGGIFSLVLEKQRGRWFIVLDHTQ